MHGRIVRNALGRHAGKQSPIPYASWVRATWALSNDLQVLEQLALQERLHRLVGRAAQEGGHRRRSGRGILAFLQPEGATDSLSTGICDEQGQ